MNHRDIREAIYHACIANEVPTLAYLIDTQLTGRLRKSYGSAYYKKRTIFLSRDLFSNADHIKQHECIVHMTCHFIVRFKWLRSPTYQTFPKLHGPEWRAAMEKTKVPITSAYCFAPSAERLSRHVFACSCRKDLRFHEELAKTVLSNSHMCARCGSQVTHLSEEAGDGLLYAPRIYGNQRVGPAASDYERERTGRFHSRQMHTRVEAGQNHQVCVSST
jgi:predicted SprT family Zn-dependent metalloprotease